MSRILQDTVHARLRNGIQARNKQAYNDALSWHGEQVAHRLVETATRSGVDMICYNTAHLFATQAGSTFHKAQYPMGLAQGIASRVALAARGELRLLAGIVGFAALKLAQPFLSAENKDKFTAAVHIGCLLGAESDITRAFESPTIAFFAKHSYKMAVVESKAANIAAKVLREESVAVPHGASRLLKSFKKQYTNPENGRALGLGFGDVRMKRVVGFEQPNSRLDAPFVPAWPVPSEGI